MFRKPYPYAFVLLSLFILIGCDPAGLDDLTIDDEPEVPEFSVHFETGDQETELFAGEEDFFMFAEYEVDPLGILTYRGRLAKDEGCDFSCSESFTIEVRDRDFLAGGTNVDEALTPGEYAYRTIDDGVFGIGFEYGADTSRLSEFQLVFGDVGTFEGPLPFLAVDPNFFEFPDLVSLTFGSEDGCSGSATYMVGLSDTEPCFWWLCATAVEPGSLYEYSLKAFGEPVGLQSIAWSTGEENTEAIFGSPDEPVSVQIIDSLGCIAILELSLNANAVDRCEVGLFWFPMIIEQPNFDFGEISLEYVDAFGTSYRSDMLEQDPLTSSFQITDIDDFELNENGDPTKKAHIRFSCDLVSPSGDFIRVENGEATMAFAFPE